MNPTAFWVAVLVLIVAFIMAMAISRRKKKWYRVDVANPEQSEPRLYRTGWDSFWRSDEAGIMVFHREDGTTVRLSKHWILRIEDIGEQK